MTVPAMTAEESRLLARRWMEEVWNLRIDTTVDDMLTDASVGHGCGAPDMHGKADFRNFRNGLFAAFGDKLCIQIVDMVAEGPQVAVRWRVTGRHVGELMGCGATGRDVDFWGMTWLRFDERRKLVEGWDAWNPGALLQELQAAPVAAGA